MIRMLRLCLPFCAAAVLLVAGDSIPAHPATSFVIDPAQTKVEFTLADTLHTVHGTFQLASGTLRFDPATGAASGEVVVDARSGDSGSKARDKRMHANILESAKYPQIAFRPDRLEGKLAPEGKSQVQLHGMFSIHGAEHEITVPAVVESTGGQYNVAATFAVPYVKWGMKNPSNLILRVGDTVEISLHTVAAASK
uniref:YceI family protein n=1 Tax=Solibacter usitatus (strain Ellin6076) TaxID=234267 RepID=Q029E4_SOLUE